MPSFQGIWPAFWMLGDNISSVGWPSCGEIDIMEHKGNEPGAIYGTLHYPGNSGGNANSSSTTIANVSSEFHVYSVIWNQDSVSILLDDTSYYSFNNRGTGKDAWPFDGPMHLLLNIAFEPIKMALKRDLKKYEQIKEKRSLAGKKSAEQRQQNSTNSTSVESVQQTSTNPTVSDSDNVSVIDSVSVIDNVLSKDNIIPEIKNFGSVAIEDFNFSNRLS